MKQFSFLKLLLVMVLLSASQFVNAQCSASFTWTIDSNGLATFTNTSQGVYDTAQWSFGDGTGAMTSPSSANITHQYNAIGPFFACLTVYTFNGPCQSTFCDTILGNPAGGGCFAFFSSNPLGGTTLIQFNNLSSGNYSSISWDFGDGTSSNLANPQHSYTTAGTYPVCITISNLAGTCNSTYCSNIVVNNSSICSAMFGHQNTGSTYYFYSSNTFGLIYNWTFGDGTTSTSQNPTHTYSQPGNYQVCLTVTDSAQTCTDYYCDSITVSSTGTCQANFSFSYNPQNGSIIDFTNLSVGGSSYFWDFGDSTTSNLQNPSHFYSQNGTYYVCLTITSLLPSCTSTYCAYVTVGNSTGCQAYFNSTPDTSNGVQFGNLSSGNYIGQYWYFGDGDTSTQSNPFHQYTTSGTYLVCLTLYNNGAICDSYCDSVVVGNPANSCVPVFYSIPDSSFGSGIVTFGIFNNCALTQYVWNFGDGTFGTGQNPIHQFADSGWYYVCVTAGGPTGSFTFCDSVYSNRMGMVGLNENVNSYSLKIYPNPLSDVGTIEFDLAVSSNVSLAIYSISGAHISNIISSQVKTGVTRLPVNVSNLENGIYLVRLNVNDNISYQKISVLK